MKKDKTQITFKPFDSIEWLIIDESKALTVLDENQFKELKKLKHYNVQTGTFKIG
jgi:hypothetical protein|tara:strand:- start:2887 stop:3051 length:165 start_codon:yes stop_codon:yes gene_type:complete